MADRHDVVVVGAGPGGSTVAHYLARHGLEVLLLDKSYFPRDKTCGDGLTPRALHVLDDIGILEAVSDLGHRVAGIEVVAPNGRSAVASVPHGTGLPEHMLIVSRRLLDNAVLERAVASGARFESGVRAAAIEEVGDGVVVRGDRAGQSVVHRARLAVVATGASTGLIVELGLLRNRPPLMLAARTYYDNVQGLADRVQFRFDGVPLPGYGWVFPLSGASANVGTGFFTTGRFGRRLPPSARAAFDEFVERPPMRELLADARRCEPVKSYPLRVDFPDSPTVGPHVLLVGECAGLVNPLTGEGIDYALESGKIAAEHLIALFDTEGPSPAGLAAYDARLRQRFQRLFIFCRRMRDLYLNRPLLNRLVTAANRSPALKALLVDVVLGNRDASEAVSARTILQVVAALPLRS